MTDEKIIDAEFSKDDRGPFDSPISAYKAGFRTAERLAKIEVLEQILALCDVWRFTGNIQARVLIMLSELKADQ